MWEQVIGNGKNADLDTVGQQGTKNSNNNSEAVLDCHSRDDSGYSVQEFIVNKNRKCNDRTNYNEYSKHLFSAPSVGINQLVCLALHSQRKLCDEVLASCGLPVMPVHAVRSFPVSPCLVKPIITKILAVGAP
jgi:hypothetical protein